LTINLKAACNSVHRYGKPTAVAEISAEQPDSGHDANMRLSGSGR